MVFNSQHCLTLQVAFADKPGLMLIFTIITHSVLCHTIPTFLSNHHLVQSLPYFVFATLYVTTEDTEQYTG